MLTRHERKELLGHGGLKRVAARASRADGKPYSLSRVSQVVNCEKTGQRNRAIELAIVAEINERRDSPLLPAVVLSDVFPPAPPAKPRAPVFPFQKTAPASSL